jgi:hypothetical protein
MTLFLTDGLIVIEQTNNYFRAINNPLEKIFTVASLIAFIAALFRCANYAAVWYN